MRRALIIGGSLGGLLAAHLLRNVGWDVVVFERNAEDLTGRGVGLSTHPELIDILRRVGIAFDNSMGITVDTLICLDRSGHAYVREPTARTMSSWGRLYRSLRDPLPPECYRLGMSLQRVEQDADGVTAVFTDGTRVTGDLLVGADGLRSTVREQFLPELAAQLRRLCRLARHAGRARGAARHPRRAVRALHVLPAGGRAAPRLSGAGPQQRDAARPARLQHRLVPAGRSRPGTGRSLHRCDRPLPRHVDPAAADPARGHGQDQGARRARWWRRRSRRFSARAQPFFQPIFDLESPQTVFGRVALLGDAAFVARPHVGAGVTKAALDAAALADAMRGDDLAAGLIRYQSTQQPFGSYLVALGREEGAYLSAQLKPREQRSAAELKRSVRDVLDAHNSRTKNLRKALVASGTQTADG